MSNTIDSEPRRRREDSRYRQSPRRDSNYYSSSAYRYDSEYGDARPRRARSDDDIQPYPLRRRGVEDEPAIRRRVSEVEPAIRRRVSEDEPAIRRRVSEDAPAIRRRSDEVSRNRQASGRVRRPDQELERNIEAIRRPRPEARRDQDSIRRPRPDSRTAQDLVRRARPDGRGEQIRSRNQGVRRPESELEQIQRYQRRFEQEQDERERRSRHEASRRGKGSKDLQKSIKYFVLELIILVILAVSLFKMGTFSLGSFNIPTFDIEESDKPEKRKAKKSETDTDVPSWVDVCLVDEGNPSRTGLALDGVADIAVHYTGNPGTTAMQTQNFYNNTDSDVSSHFVVGMDGEIVMCIPLNERSSATNHRNNDTISIEVAHPTADGKFTDESYQALIKLVNWLRQKYNLSTDHVIRHYDVTGKECPRYYVQHPEAWEQFKRDLGQ